MGKQTVLCVILVVVLVGLFMLVKNCGKGEHHKHQAKKHQPMRRLGVRGPVNPNSFPPQLVNPCDILTHENLQYNPATIPVCNEIGKLCGVPSLLNYVVGFVEGVNPTEDGGGLNEIKQDLATFQADRSQCPPPGQCDTNSDCQPNNTNFGLKCKNITCVPDDCKPEEECTPGLVCKGSCL